MIVRRHPRLRNLSPLVGLAPGLIQSALCGLKAAHGRSLASFSLLRLASELRVRRAGLSEFSFEMTDPPSQELLLLGDGGHSALGFLERRGRLVGGLLGCD